MLRVLDVEQERIAVVDTVHGIEDVRLLNNRKLSRVVPCGMVGVEVCLFERAAAVDRVVLWVGDAAILAFVILSKFFSVPCSPAEIIRATCNFTFRIIRLELI
jgi:hypothetical protein